MTLARSILALACFAWIFPEILGWKFKRSPESSNGRDRNSLSIIVFLWLIGIALAIACHFWVPKATISSRAILLLLGGSALMIAGSAFRWFSVRILGKYFTFDVAVHPDHVVIEAGPYRYVRHPSYSGALVSSLGFGLALNNWAGLAAVISGLGIAYSYRIPVEEAALAEAIGEPYRQYQRRTWRLLPFIY